MKNTVRAFATAAFGVVTAAALVVAPVLAQGDYAGQLEVPLAGPPSANFTSPTPAQVFTENKIDVEVTLTNETNAALVDKLVSVSIVAANKEFTKANMATSDFVMHGLSPVQQVTFTSDTDTADVTFEDVVLPFAGTNYLTCYLQVHTPYSNEIEYCGGSAVGSVDAVQVAYTGRAFPAYRFYNGDFKSHFFTASAGEAQGIIKNNFAWAFEGVAFNVLRTADCVDALPVYRFWSMAYSTHFYTISEAEKNNIVANNPNWSFEGSVYCAYPTDQAESTDPVFRLWNNTDQRHFYTLSEEERDQLVTDGWNYEGVAYYAMP